MNFETSHRRSNRRCVEGLDARTGILTRILLLFSSSFLIGRASPRATTSGAMSTRASDLRHPIKTPAGVAAGGPSILQGWRLLHVAPVSTEYSVSVSGHIRGMFQLGVATKYFQYASRLASTGKTTLGCSGSQDQMLRPQNTRCAIAMQKKPTLRLPLNAQCHGETSLGKRVYADSCNPSQKSVEIEIATAASNLVEIVIVYALTTRHDPCARGRAAIHGVDPDVQ